MIFKCENMDFGFKHNGTSYIFTDCDGMTLDDGGKAKHITRGLNATNKVGIPYTENLNQPDVITMPTLNMPKELFELLQQLYADETRISAFAIDRKTGASRFINNALIQKPPKQLNIQDGADNLKVELVIESFDVDDKLKEAA